MIALLVVLIWRLIEAPPETASTLAMLFSGMAQLLQAAVASVDT